MATRKTETTRTTRAAKKTTGRQAAKATAKKAAARKQPATTRTSRRAAAAPEPVKRGRGRPRKDEAVAAPKRGPGRPRKDETTVAAKRTPRKPADKTVSRPRPNKAQEEQPTRRRRASPTKEAPAAPTKEAPAAPTKEAPAAPTKEAPAAPRMRRSAITDPKTHPWYQGVLRADFDGMTKGDRVFAQREVRPMFAGLVNVWRLLGTIDGASARLRVSEHQGGSHLKNLVKWQTVLDEGAEKPRVRSSRDNPAAHAKLDHAFAKLDAQE